MVAPSADAEHRSRGVATQAVGNQPFLSQESIRVLGAKLGRSLDAVVVNGLLPQRFTPAELHQIATLAGQEPAGPSRRRGGGNGTRARSDAAVLRSAALAAQTVHDRARFQHNQVARLRRRAFEVVGVPFVWTAGLDLPAVERLAEHLGRRM